MKPKFFTASTLALLSIASSSLAAVAKKDYLVISFQHATKDEAQEHGTFRLSTDAALLRRLAHEERLVCALRLGSKFFSYTIGQAAGLESPYYLQLDHHDFVSQEGSSSTQLLASLPNAYLTYELEGSQEHEESPTPFSRALA